MVKRKIWEKRIEKLKKRLSDNELPVTIKKGYIFGSFVDGKEKPHDLDVLLVYSDDEDWVMNRLLDGKSSNLFSPLNAKLRKNLGQIQFFWDQSFSDFLSRFKDENADFQLFFEGNESSKNY